MFIFRFVIFLTLFYAFSIASSPNKILFCSIEEVYKKEFDQITKKPHESTKIKAFGTVFTFPSRYIYSVKEGSQGESIMSGNLLSREPIQYQGCTINKSILGHAWFGSRDKCDRCKKGAFSDKGVSVRQLKNIKINDVTIDVYELSEKEKSRVYVAYFYDKNYFLAVMDRNYQLINALSNTVQKNH